MNWSRGFLRIWVVVAIGWIASVALYFWSDVRNEFGRAATFGAAYNFILQIPADCAKARGSSGTDYRADEKGPWLDHGGVHTCWYDEPRFRVLFPEYADLSDDDLLIKTYAAVGSKVELGPKPWRLLGIGVFHALFWPTLLLAIGMALRWALNGFSKLE